MKPTRVVALVVGCLLLLPSLAVLAGGVAVGAAYTFGRDDDGFFETSVDDVASPTAAVRTEDFRFYAEPGSPDWLVDALETDVRLRVTGEAERPVFVGIADAEAVDAYLAGVAHDEIVRLDGNDAVKERRNGRDELAPPADETLWVATASGPGTQQLDWEASDGRWVAVVANADGSPGVATDVDVGVRVDGILPAAIVLTVLGLLLTAVSVGLIVFGARGRSDEQAAPVPLPVGTAAPARPGVTSPVALHAELDPRLSRWQWLVKWFLAIPHFVVLVFLWVAFVVTTIVAGVAVLFTGRYPRGLFDFNVGVLRWTWRVSYYATTGGLGTDEYPPFRLSAQPGDHATLEIEYPGRLSRGLVLVKWLLALPHWVVVGLLVGGASWSVSGSDDRVGGGFGLLGILVLVAGVALLFRGRYPRGLFDLVIGLNRWIYRVIAYVALMTDEYPPFRLDQGGSEVPAAPEPPPGPPAGEPVDVRDQPLVDV